MSVSRFLQQAAAGNAGGATYVDDVFSTYLYEGNGTNDSATNQIQNGLDLSGEGGFVWIKKRSGGSTGKSHSLFDTERGIYSRLKSDTSDAENINSTGVSTIVFNSDGFTVQKDSELFNQNGRPYVSWAFREQPGFFDIVTYTGNGTAGRTVSHNLGSVPGMIAVKRRDASSSAWQVYHRANTANPETDYLALNGTAATTDSTGRWNDTAPTSTEFTLGTSTNVNANGGTYVAYLFAHDDQRFGTGSDESIIKCGSFTGGSVKDIDLGFEPQFLLYKKAIGGTGDWVLYDAMRGVTADGNNNYLAANANDFEGSATSQPSFTATGFRWNSTGGSGDTFIYMAIRRPHKPASEFAATELFKTVAGRSDSTSPTYETGFVTDMGIQRRPATTESNLIFSRLTGNKYNDTDNNSDAEATGSSIAWDYMNGALDYFSSAAYRFWGWKRAPGFFDVVAYTGTGSARTIAHNLGAVPEMIWVIPRSFAERKPVYNKESGNQVWNDLTHTYTGNADSSGAYWNSTTPTASVFSLGTTYRVNGNNSKYVAYLFASVDGISKIGSYTGTGSSDIDIDCGFSNGSRFVLIKCIGGNAAGNHYYLFDSERGIASGNDPYITLDTTSTSAYGAQDAIDPLSSGFKVRSTAVDGINASGGTYLFYAIA